MSETPTEPGYYAVIPLTVLEDHRLRANAKLLYAEISSLARKDGVCRATNAYLAKRLAIAKRSIESLIRELAVCDYLKVKVVWVKGGPLRDICLPSPQFSGVLPAIQRKPPRRIAGSKESINKSKRESGVYTLEERERLGMGIFPR